MVLLVICVLIASSLAVLVALQPKATAAASAGASFSTQLFSPASPSIPSSEIPLGGSVFDTSTLTNVKANAGGTVSYSFFDNGVCTNPPIVTPTVANGLIVTVANGPVVPPSPSETFSSAGNYSWNAVYSGGLRSSCEPLKVDKAKPSLSISLSSSRITVGTSASTLALLTNPSSTAGGTVQYEYFPDNYCKGEDFTVGPPADVTDGVVPPSYYKQFSSAGNYSWNAVYSGDGNNTGTTSPCDMFIVDAAVVKATTGLVAVGGSSLPITVGGSVEFSVSLSGATSNAGGKVTYRYFPGAGCKFFAKTVGSPVKVTDGVVPNSAPQMFHSAGLYSSNAVYTGDSNNTGTTGTCETFTVSKASPTITLSLSNTSIAVQTPVTVSATLSGGFYDRGTVTYNRFSGDACTGNPLETFGPAAVTNNSVQSSGWIPDSPGSNSWNAVYSGDLNNTGAPSNPGATSLCEAVTVNRAGVKILTELSSNSIDVRQSVTDTAILSGTTGNPGGTVTFEFFSGNYCSGTLTTVGTVSVTSNRASITSQPFYTSGSYSWNAVYSGVPGTANNGATSPCEQLAVGTFAYTALTVSCTRDSAVVGSTTTCTATVYGSRTSAPNGTVAWSFSGSGKNLTKSACTLPKHKIPGKCSVKFELTAAGPLVITASYGGDPNNRASSAVHTVTATAKLSKTTVSCSPTSVPAASSKEATTVKCRATVRGYGDLTNEGVVWTASGTGFVSFSTATCTLVKGSCSVTLTGTQPGSVVVTATYGGDSNNLGSFRTAKLTITKAT